jgi:hypothetical protein
MKTEVAEDREQTVQLPEAELYSRSHTYVMVGTPLEKVPGVHEEKAYKQTKETTFGLTSSQQVTLP